MISKIPKWTVAPGSNIQINSVAIDVYGKDGETLDQLLLAADRRLYLAKDSGRNCVMSQDNIVEENLSPILTIE